MKFTLDPVRMEISGPVKAEKELIAIEHQIGEAVMKQDTAFLDRVWADDFTYGGVRGEIRTKAEVLGDIKSGGLKFVSK